MKNKFKIILIIFLVIILTGCSGNYNLVINDDMSVEEEIDLVIDNKNDTYDKTLKIFEENNINIDNYDVSVIENEVHINYKENFDSLEEYIVNSKVYHLLFNEIVYNKTSDYIDLYIDQNLKILNSNTIINGSNLTDFNVIQINITNPFDVNMSNAEMINDNVYTWTITKDDVTKKIQMQFKPQLNVFPYREVIVGSVILICFAIILISIYIRYRKKQKI